MPEIAADLLLGMFGVPLTHHVVGPVPLKRVSVEAVVLRPGGIDMIQELLSAAPRRAFQVTMAEGTDQQFRLVKPGCMGRRKAGTPPTSAVRPICRRSGCRVAGIAILDQE